MNDQLRRRSVGAPAARSALLTILGEFQQPMPDGAWQETLVSALGALGYTIEAARQALARSVSAGWLTTERHGRRSRLRLTPDSVVMLRSGAERIYGFGDPWVWDGRWLLVAIRVPEVRREVRHQLRTRLAWDGFGSLGGGLWISPHVEREAGLGDLATNGSAGALLSFRAETGSFGDLSQLISDAWDLDVVAQTYRDFTARFSRLQPEAPAAVFRAQTELVHAWRKFPFLDPDLPESLLPPRWPRARAYDLFQDRHARWHESAQHYFRSLEEGNAATSASSKSSRTASK